MSISQNFPNIDPTLRLNFQGARRLDPRITFTRSSTATYVDEDGLIKTAAADEARFDYDPETGESLGLLIEEQRTKVRNNVSYPLGSLSATSSTDITAPDGTTSGIIKITSPSFTNTSGVQQRSVDTSYFAHTVVQNVYYSSSIYMYATGSTDNSRKIDIGYVAGGCIDAPGGVTLSSCGYIDGQNVVSSTSPLTNTILPKDRWVRVFVNWRSPCNGGPGNFGGQIRVLYNITNNQQNTNFINSSGNPVIYLWGATVETNYSTSSASFPTSYIYGNNVTRQPDNTQITGTNFSSWYNQSEGTVSFRAKSPTNPDQYPVVIDDSTNNNRHLFAISDAYQYQIKVSGSTEAQIDAGSVFSSFNYIAGGYKTNNTAVALNGSVDVDNVASIPTCNRLSIYQFSGFTFTGTISRLTYYPKRLKDTSLQYLTQ